MTFLRRSSKLKRFPPDLSWARLQFIWDALQLSRISTGGNFIKNFSPSSSSPFASNHHAFARQITGGLLSKRELNYVRKFIRGVDEYFSCYFENHSSGLKANLGGKLPTIVVAMFPSLFSCYNNIKNKPNKVALTYCWYVQCFGKQKSLMNDWLTKRLKSRYQYFGIQSNNLEWRHVCFKIRILMKKYI